MDSRRTMTRSSSGNGRSSNGDDLSGNSRPSSCSYLSNVRPENRSTLCSVIAQLTEETQPSFETTLKTKAVSENSNVKFSCVVTGYPSPQVTWYKDDMQLDRYCGLPKYEVFRNGQNHSLHIYNCTVEDAAMYQASASNTKGIVACSGVLEVGEMNEFKIHQRYFAKLKQKAENKRREAEGKENQEPLRTISPDRTLRKRRSTMDAFLSTPSSMEDEGNEESHEAVTLETEDRLQVAAVEEVEEKPVPITNGAVSAVTNGQIISENGNKNGTYIYDSAQKIFTAHQPKTPFVKKKIKISNSAPGERTSEERNAKEEALTSVATTCTESVKSEEKSEEFMEVENSVSLSVVDSNFRNMTERHHKSEMEDVLHAERPSKVENISIQQQEKLTASVPAAAPAPTSRTVSGTEGKKAAKLEKEAAEHHLEMKNQSPHMTPTQRRSNAAAAPRTPRSTAKGNTSKTEHVMDVDKKSNSSTGGSSAHRDTEPVKILTAHQSKTPFVKKKIKISNSAPGEQTSVERNAKDEALTSVAESVKSEGKSEEFMEVENRVSSSVVDTGFRNVTERHQKSEMEDVLLGGRPSKDENICVERKKEQLTASVPAAAPAPTSHTVSGTEGKKAAKLEKEAAEQHLEMKNQRSHVTPTQRHTSAAATSRSTTKENISKTEHIMDVDKKSNTSTGGSLAHRDTEPVNTPCESRTALPQRPCEQAGDQLPAKETSPCQKTVSVSQPALLNEVTQAHTKMSRNDAPVSLELPPNKMDAPPPPQKTPSQREIMADDVQTPSLHHGPQAAIDKMTQDTWGHSRGSNESHTLLFTDIQKSALQSPGGGENSRGCSVSSSAQQSRIDTAIKTVEGTEIQVEEKVNGNEVGKLLVQSDSKAPHEKIVAMETESAALHVIEHTESEKTNSVAETDVIIVDASNKITEKNERILKMAEEASSALQNLKSSLFEPGIPLLTKTSENMSELQIKDFQEIPKAVTKVISVAELLRSQIKALESTIANSVTALPVHTGFVQDPPTTVTQTCKEFKEDDSKLEVKKSFSDRKTETSVDNTPPKNIKETLMEVYNLLYDTDQELIQPQGSTSPPVQALQTHLVIPPIAAVDSGTTRETAGLQSSDINYNEGVIMDICQEAGASTLVPMKDDSVVSLSGNDNVKHNVPPSTSTDELNKTLETVTPESGTPPAGTPIEANSQESNITVLEHAKDEPLQGKDMGVMQTPETKLNSEIEEGITEMKSTTLDQYKMEDHDTKNNSLQQSVQKVPSKIVPGTDIQGNNLHVIQQDSTMVEELQRTDDPTPEASPRLKKRDCVSPIPSATPQELASGARRKILVPKAKPEEASEATPPLDNQTQKKEVPTESGKLSASPVTPLSTSPSLSRRSPLLQPPTEQTSPAERRSPLVSRRKTPSETQAQSQPPTEEIHALKTEKPAEKDKHDPFKAPQVIRKIRGENFADASGHLKLWCQFFNVLSDSTIRWYKNEERIAQIKRNAGDESQVNLAIVQASRIDSGVYGCTITNEYGTDSTDCLLSADIMAGMSLREDLGVGEEIEMTPLVFSKGVADSGIWGNKFFGRIMMQESHIGDGCSHKVWRAKVIYGLEPVFESGNTCIIKVRNPIAYGGKAESCLIDRNLEIVKQECKIQNLAREYCKIFSAEARVIESFGPSLEVIPVYLMYRPANTVPYATVEVDLTGVYQKYSVLDDTGRIDMRSGSDVEQKCCALQHWIFQWTNGNLLITRLEGVDTKITNIGISVKSTGHQGLSVEGNPKVFDQFVSQHQCNYFCGLLSLRSLKVMDSLLTPTKPKASRSPLLQRKMASGSSSPQTGRKAAVSPRLPRKTEQEGAKTPAKQIAADAPKAV